MRELDLRFECPQLKIAWRAVAVVVESGLADRHAPLVGRQGAQLGQIGHPGGDRAPAVPVVRR